MKARFNALALAGLALSALPLLTGCTEDGAGQGNALVSSAAAEPAPVAASTNAPAEASPSTAALASSAVVALAENSVTGTAAAPVPAPAAEAEKKLPASLKPSTPAGEVIKLAQAGVEETVMLTYITNSTSMFSLTSDDIIYLNDLGVAGNVITAMIHHDQALKSYWANQTVAAEPTNAAAPTYVEPPQPQPAATEVAVAPPPTPAANVTYNYFYDSLSPYGTWVDIEGYGRCWQPTVVVVNRNWRPYSDGGHWVYTDCGWYWMSDYSWGWAPFHYGRWFPHARYGWCWWPDRVWAPSWVSWRYSNAYCGWAPLPPAAYYRSGFGFSYYGSSVGLSFNFGLGADCFTFVSWNNFCDRRPWRHRLPAREVTQVFNNTTIVNNYGNGNNTVINHGIPRERVRELTRTEIQPVAIREHNPAEGRGGRGERFANDGKSLIVRRPRIPESATPQMPTAPGGRQVRDNDHRTPTTGAGSVALRESARGTGEGRSGERPHGQPAATTPTATTRPAPAPPPTANVESPRARGSERAAEISRERSRQTANPPAPVTANPPVASRTPPATPAPVATPAPANPTPRENRSLTPRPTEERREAPNRERRRDGSQAPQPAPVVANPPASTVTPAPATRTAPPGSVVVIGRGNQASTPARTEAPVSTARNTYNWTPPTSSAAPSQPRVNPTPQPAPAPARPNREVGRESVPSRPTYSAPPPSAPTPAPSRPAPSYTAPARPTYTPPAPSYNAPRPSAPTYSAPSPAPVQRSQPSAPAYRAPSPSPAPSYSPPPRSSGNSESRSSSSSSDRGEQRGGGRR